MKILVERKLGNKRNGNQFIENSLNYRFIKICDKFLYLILTLRSHKFISKFMLAIVDKILINSTKILLSGSYRKSQYLPSTLNC